MNLETERMCHAGQTFPAEGKKFGSLFQQGFYINYLHGLNFLCKKHISKDTNILELGCFYGTSSRLFYEHSNNLTCVDIELYSEMQNLINSSNIKFYKQDSTEFLKNINVGQYDLIYIDTTHDYGKTKQEILLAYSKIKNGQILSGHDYNSAGVFNAVLDVFEYPDIEIYLDSS
jgi:SAM-dependent methyltransferase